MKRRFGYTLMELLVAMAMVMVVGTAMIRIFWFGIGVEREARSAYLISADADVAFKKLQDDLRLTSLSTIRVDDQDRGFSLASPLKDNDKGTFSITDFGVANWKSWVHYTVNPQNTFTGNLVRWESPYDQTKVVPLPSPHDPIVVGETKWNILEGVVVSGTRTEKSKEGEQLVGLESDKEAPGGLRLRFLRRENGKEVLARLNPSQRSDSEIPGWSKGTTEIVDCRLQVADKSSESGKWSIYTLHFRVRPRN